MTSQLNDDTAAATAWPEHLDPASNRCSYSGMLRPDTREDECPNVIVYLDRRDLAGPLVRWRE